MEQHYQDLLNRSDEYLFLNGGCHVFALALHEQFRYPLVCVRKSCSNCVPHVYCRYGEYLVDVMGFAHEKQVLDTQLWNVHPFFATLATLSELESHYVVTFPCSGLYGDELFLCQARLRAERRITDYITFYNGTCRQSIEPHPLLKGTSEADIESIFR